MSKKTLIILSISLLTLIFLFNSCGDNSTTPPPASTTITVTGKVIDFIGGGIAGVTVSIGDQTATTAADGTFSLGNIKPPYDLKLISGGTTGLVYKALNSFAPQIYAPGVGTTPSSASVTVNIPASVIPQGRRAIVIFTDSLKIQDGNLITGPATSVNFTVQWPGSSTLPGKIIVLIANVNVNGNITGYTVYGEKPYTLNNGSPATINFATGDFTVNPGSATVSGNLSIPTGYTIPVTSMTMSYVSAGALYSGIQIDESGQSFSYTVPTGLPTPFKLYLRGSAQGGLPQENTNKMMSVTSGSSGNTLTLDPVPSLSTPANNATGIDTNTIFTYSSTSGTGMYILTAIAGNKRFYVLTANTTANLPNLAAYGLALGSNVNYQWSVQRILGINSTDDFVSTVFLYNTNFNGITSSTSRTFTSAP